ncbi:MAG: hypothetical protein JWP74_2979 [Marmoricola sp.]|nr:hypothetical protein [Marmoricola sp.]
MSTNAELPHPIRVVVQGTSLSVTVPEREGERGEYTFPRWVQNGMHDRGIAAEVIDYGIVGHPTRMAFRDWDTKVLASTPDVVIFSYGFYECVHALLPHWLERHVNDLQWRRGPVRTIYRRHLLRPFWLALAHTQKALDKVIQARLFGRKKQRAIDDYELLITRTRRYVPGNPLVFVFTLMRPGGEAGSWFPGMSARIDAMNEAIIAMVERIDDPLVRLIPALELSTLLPEGHDPVPDGLHYTPPMRRVVGDWIAAQISDELARPSSTTAAISE